MWMTIPVVGVLRRAVLPLLLLAVATNVHAAEQTSALVGGRIDRSFDVAGLREPSGIVFHPSRQTLFAVGDQGDLAEIGLDGRPVRMKRLRDGDFEGIAVDPATGLLYVAVEGEERIIEVDPETFAIRREFAIDRTIDGDTLLAAGRQGIEAIAFVPDPRHPEGGTFFVANQGWGDSDPCDASVIVEVVARLRTSRTGGAVRIVRSIRPGIEDIAGLLWDPVSERLVGVSDTRNAAFALDLVGRVTGTWDLPGDAQEGIAFDIEGNVYIAQDSGGIICIRGGPFWR